MARSGPRRVALLGGTFDPIHQGHLVFARAARNALGLDQLIFMVAARPPHKPGRRVASFAHRLAMARLAVAKEPGFVVSDLEGQRNGPSYSVDTLRVLRQQLGPETTLFFLVGSDAFLEMAEWKEYSLLPRLARLVVAHRPGADFSLAAEVRAKFGRQARQDGSGCWLLPDGGRVQELVLEPLAISSTSIRAGAAQGSVPGEFLPPEVDAYIARHHLYGRGEEAV